MGLLVTSGKWARFDHYVMVEERIRHRIRPAAGAAFVPYDFADLWSERATGRNDYQTPLMAALALVGDLESLTGTPAERDTTRESLLLAWVERFGLLGLLACETAYVRVPGDGEDGFEVVRAGGGFLRQQTPAAQGGEPDPGEMLVVGPDYLDDEALRLTRIPAADGRAPGWFETEAFWRGYSESSLDIFDHLQRLRDGLRLLRQGEQSPWLLYLLSGTSLWTNPGPTIRVRCSSLLSLIAASGIQGDGGEWPLRDCRCGRLFVATDARQKYHDDRCRERFKKRDQRERQAASGSSGLHEGGK